MHKQYKQRILKAIKFIEANLNESLSLDSVATHSHFSPFHFHRVFGGVMNETLNDFIARRRLEVAINKLVTKTDLSITTIAFESGFSSSANFAKAVKQHFGHSPSQIRKGKSNTDSKIGKILSKYGKAFNPVDLYPYRLNQHSDKPQLAEVIMNVQLKTYPQQTICKLASDGGYQPEALFKTWDMMTSWAEGRGVEMSAQQRIALCYDNPAITPVEKCRYEATITIDDEVKVNLPFEKSILPGGTYAVLYVKGDAQDVAKAQMGLFCHWLPDSGYEPDSFPMMERYLNDVRQDGFIELEIMFKLKTLVQAGRYHE
jgi:AraC family transcriptional regulator